MAEGIKTLGFIFSNGVIRPDPVKIDMLLKAPPPKDRTALRGFLALLQQFRSMLVHLSHTCHKLYELTSTKVPYTWTEEHNNAFLAVKDMLSKHILNNHFDPDKQTTLISIYGMLISLQFAGYLFKKEKLLLASLAVLISIKEIGQQSKGNFSDYLFH